MKLPSIKIIPYLIIFLLMSCNSQTSVNKPPTIRYGEDACDECRMIINEARFASAFVTLNKEVRRFDDIGCMIIYQKKHSQKVASIWVHDFKNQKWLKTEEAFFISSDSLTTPMGYGIVAVGKKAVADSLAKSYFGTVLNWEQIFQQVNKKD